MNVLPIVNRLYPVISPKTDIFGWAHVTFAEGNWVNWTGVYSWGDVAKAVHTDDVKDFWRRFMNPAVGD